MVLTNVEVLALLSVPWLIRFPRYRHPRRHWHVMRANCMARTAASAELWSTSIGKSGWRALAASWLGWMLCCSDYRLETLHSDGKFALFPGSTHVKASTKPSLAFLPPRNLHPFHPLR